MKRKRKYRKLLAAILTICMVMTATGGAFAASKVTFGEQQVTVDTFNGVPAYYKIGNHNEDSTYSCAAYVKRYYSHKYGVSVYNLLTGCTPKSETTGYSFKQVNASQVKPGDIGYQTNSKDKGHWFIIKTVSGKSMTIIEQNWKGKDNTAPVDRIVTFGVTKNLKVFRLYKNGADANNGGSGSPVVAPAANQLIPNGRYAIMVNGSYCLNVQFASKTSGSAKLCIDGYNGESNELFDITYINGYYRISPVHAPNLALNCLYGKDGKAGQQLVCHTWSNGDSASLWSVEKYSDGYRFRNKANPNLYIDVANNKKSTVGNRINMWTKVNGSQQTLYLKSAGGGSNGGNTSANTSAAKDWSGTWAIKANSRYCLNVQYASKISDLAKCVIDPYNGESNERFKFTKYGNYYRISPLHAPNLALNAQYGKDAKAGQQLSLHTWRDGDAASLWSIEDYGSGVRFRNKANPNLIIDVTNAQKSTTGCKIILWKQNGDEAQRFYLERA
ncbi:MAG: ricin-type beta-trefoil lectin domain protein [Firmicutes bacterium]|nr:ricin-type beta-trefoil lectin domain protein [Bacillota bacterium]